ncbi:MAG TPA: transcription elongation factor GreA, partial [Solirubrobacterales bacterium]|nr:transcription elongation factor GreA [Solirubrobacterales bacterium]
MNGPEQSGEPITAAGIEELKAELAQLEGPARQEMAARIKVARELGDLKENADYHIAKEDQAHLETRIKRLQERLRNAVVVEVDGGGDTFAF